MVRLRTAQEGRHRGGIVARGPGQPQEQLDPHLLGGCGPCLECPRAIYSRSPLPAKRLSPSPMITSLRNRPGSSAATPSSTRAPAENPTASIGACGAIAAAYLALHVPVVGGVGLGGGAVAGQIDGDHLPPGVGQQIVQAFCRQPWSNDEARPWTSITGGSDVAPSGVAAGDQGLSTSIARR